MIGQQSNNQCAFALTGVTMTEDVTAMTEHEATRETEQVGSQYQLLQRPTFTLHGTPEAFCRLLVAIGAAKAEFSEIVKTKQVRYEDNKGRVVDYKYAPLAAIDEASRKALAAHGITIAFLPTRRSAEELCQTTLVSGHGAVIESVFKIYDVGNLKDFGGDTTYIRRYITQCVLNIEGDQDSDDTPADSLPALSRAPAAQPGKRAPTARTQAPPPNNQPARPKAKPEPERAEATSRDASPDKALGCFMKHETPRDASQRTPTEPPAAQPRESAFGTPEWRVACITRIQDMFVRLECDHQRIKSLLRQALETETPPKSDDMTTDQLAQLERFLSSVVEDAGV